MNCIHAIPSSKQEKWDLGCATDVKGAFYSTTLATGNIDPNRMHRRDDAGPQVWRGRVKQVGSLGGAEATVSVGIRVRVRVCRYCPFKEPGSRCGSRLYLTKLSRHRVQGCAWNKCGLLQLFFRSGQHCGAWSLENAGGIGCALSSFSSSCLALPFLPQ
jgi:hypothetical protein